MGLTVNREKTKTIDLRERHAVLVFLGYEFRYVRDIRFGTGERHLHFGPAMKSLRRIRHTIHEHTHARNCLVAVKTIIERLNRVLSGWARYFSAGDPSRAFGKVNHYVLRRMARWLNRRGLRHLSAEMLQDLLRRTRPLGASAPAMGGLPPMSKMKVAYLGIDRKKNTYTIAEICNGRKLVLTEK